MPRLKISSQAAADLDEIWLFIARDQIEAADAMIDRITGQFHSLLVHPLAGRERLDLGVDLRSVPVGNYIIFYKAMKNEVTIIRVLHGGRDANAFF